MTKKKRNLKGKSPRSFYGMTRDEALILLRKLGSNDRHLLRLRIKGHVLAK